MLKECLYFELHTARTSLLHRNLSNRDARTLFCIAPCTSQCYNYSSYHCKSGLRRQCICSQVCRGSYLNLTGEGSFQKVLKEWHGLLDRHQLMFRPVNHIHPFSLTVEGRVRLFPFAHCCIKYSTIGL